MRSIRRPPSVPLPSLPLKTRFIVNLRSGGAARLVGPVREFAQQRGADVVLTEHVRHASALAAEAIAEGFELVVAVGGDGTMNEVATALVGTQATLGLIPAGSGDGFGRHLGLHGPVQHALRILDHGRIQTIDTGVADGHAFFCAAGIGFEAEIAHRFNQSHRRGFFRYLLTSARAFRTWQPQEYTLAHGVRRETLRAFTLVVANASQYGNNARIAPRARMDDGKLDLCVVPPLTLWNIPPLAARLFAGNIDSAPSVVSQQRERFVIERAAPGFLHTDGELHEAGTRLEFTVRPASLRVMVRSAQAPG